MHETGRSGMVHWDDPEGWDGKGGGPQGLELAKLGLPEPFHVGSVSLENRKFMGKCDFTPLFSWGKGNF